jgi:hypothetical protein
MGGRHSNGYATRDAALAAVDRMRAATDHKLADFGGSRDEAIADVLVYAKEYFASRVSPKPILTGRRSPSA